MLELNAPTRTFKHFNDEKPEAGKGEVTCPKSHTMWGVNTLYEDYYIQSQFPRLSLRAAWHIQQKVQVAGPTNNPLQ